MQKRLMYFSAVLAGIFNFSATERFCLSHHIQRNGAVGTSVIQDGDSVGLDYNLNGFSLVIISMVKAFHMRAQAIQANVKLQVIRNDFGHHPAIARTFHMLDSIYHEPIPPPQP